MLRGIAVYQISEYGLIKLKSANNKPLSFFEEKIYPRYKDDIIAGIRTEVCLLDANKKIVLPICYFVYLPESRSKLYVIEANKEIDQRSLYYLMVNIGHADERSSEMELTLEKILNQSTTYCEFNVEVQKLNEKMQKTIQTQMQTMDTLFQRGQRIKEAQAATDGLEKTSDHFKLNTDILDRQSKFCSYCQ